LSGFIGLEVDQLGDDQIRDVLGPQAFPRKTIPLVQQARE